MKKKENREHRVRKEKRTHKNSHSHTTYRILVQNANFQKRNKEATKQTITNIS